MKKWGDSITTATQQPTEKSMDLMKSSITEWLQSSWCSWIELTCDELTLPAAARIKHQASLPAPPCSIRPSLSRSLEGGGGQILPSYLTCEPVDVARRARRRSKVVTFGGFRNFLKKVTSPVEVRSKVKIVTFSLSATKMRLTTAANPNWNKRLSKGWKK